jgi:hypothetical protein
VKSRVPFRFHLYRNLFISTERFGEPLIEVLPPGGTRAINR